MMEENRKRQEMLEAQAEELKKKQEAEEKRL